MYITIAWILEKKLFSNRFIPELNKLPDNVTSAPNIDNFKVELEPYLQKKISTVPSGKYQVDKDNRLMSAKNDAVKTQS